MIVALLTLVVAVPAFGKVHKDVFPVPCSDLWDAVQDTIKNSGSYTPILADNTQMTAAFHIGGAIHSRDLSVHLEPQGSGCEMQTSTSFSGVFQSDAGDFKSRVEQSLAKLKGSKPAEAARPAN
jgi:hypothetical protein